MPYSQVSLDAGGSRWTLSVPQAQRKLPLKFVPSQTCGNFVELQIWMTGLLFVLVAMQVSKTLHDVQTKLIQLAMRLHWPVQKIHGGNGWERGAGSPGRRETLNRSEGSNEKSTGIWQWNI